MRTIKILFVSLLILLSCQMKEKKYQESGNSTQLKNDFVIAFGSCNNQNLENGFWNEILKNKPNVWIWGGDNIYADTEDMNLLRQNYSIQKNKEDYQGFIDNLDVLATWDDHDYGKNDAGTEYPKKNESQQLFLDFIDGEYSNWNL